MGGRDWRALGIKWQHLQGLPQVAGNEPVTIEEEHGGGGGLVISDKAPKALPSISKDITNQSSRSRK